METGLIVYKYKYSYSSVACRRCWSLFAQYSVPTKVSAVGGHAAILIALPAVFQRWKQPSTDYLGTYEGISGRCRLSGLSTLVPTTCAIPTAYSLYNLTVFNLGSSNDNTSYHHLGPRASKMQARRAFRDKISFPDPRPTKRAGR